MSESKLTASQRAFLRSAGRRLDPLAAVGKAGVDAAFVAHVRRLLETRELVKVRLAEKGPARRPAAEALAGRVGAQAVDVIGRMVLLYRANDRLAPDDRLALPGG